MAVTLSVTINSQELIDAFIAYNNRLNTQNGENLTATQRAKQILLGLLKERLIEDYRMQKLAVLNTIEAEVQAEATRVQGLT